MTQQKKDDDDDDETVQRLIINANGRGGGDGGHISVVASDNHIIGDQNNASSSNRPNNEMSIAKVKRKSTVGSHKYPPTVKKLTLTWEDLNVYKPKSAFYYLKTKLGQHAYKEDKHIVKNVTGLARPFEILAILGASGSGKTTLLNALNMRNQGELMVRGEVRVNGRLINSMEEISAVAGYVQQNDLFIGTLRVREHLTFQAMLRMDPHLTQKERRARVQEVIKYFNLSKCENSMIGCPEFGIKGISGGERRRLSFASEILTNPSILFCDEPTSGLDSFMALSIIESMKRLAKNGKTIVFTIHQPSSDLFEKFDRVCFVSEGRLAFLGDRTQAYEFFDSQHFTCPSNYNPAEFYIKTLSISPFARDVCLDRVNSIADGFEASSFNDNIKSEISRIKNQAEDNNGEHTLSNNDFNLYRTSVFTQFFWLMWRNIKAIKRDTASTRILLIQSVAIGIMYGLIFFRIEKNQEGIMNVNALIFLSVIYACVIYLFTECKTFPVEIQIFLREHQNGMYKVISYYMSKSLIEVPIHIICPFVFVSIFYWMADLSDDPKKYLLYVFVIILASQTSVSFGHFLSAISPTVTVASGLAGPILGPLMIFSGHLLNNSSTPTYFLWLKYLSWLSYANEAILMTHWKGVENIKCSEYSPRCLSTGEHVLNHLHVDDGEFAYTIYMQILLIIGWRTMAILVLLIRSYTN